MARGEGTRKRRRGRKVLRVSLPKKTYLILEGIAGGDKNRLERLVRGILEEKLETSTVGELTKYLTRKSREVSEEESVKEGEAGEPEAVNSEEGDEEESQ